MARHLIWSHDLLDDRGQRHCPQQGASPETSTSFRLLSRREFKKRREADPAARSAFIRRQMLKSRATHPFERWLLAGLVPIVLAIPIIALVSNAPVSTPMLLIYLGAIAGMVAISITVDRRTTRRHARDLDRLPLACIACRYDLTGIPPAGDGCTVCPECGAAWDFDRFDDA